MKTRKKKCDHWWKFEHTLWQGRGRDNVCVLRYCTKCKTAQCANANNWHSIPKSQVDMKKVAREAFNK